MMDLLELMEELNSMLERKTSAVCSITKSEYSRTLPHLTGSLTQIMGLEEAIPFLFQADIDQYVVTDVSTQQVISHADICAYSYYINIRLVRSI